MAKNKLNSDGGSAPKAKGLFDHIAQIREKQDPNYFHTLTDADKKTWSNYMICRFLSMQSELVEVINDLQVYQDKLTPEQFYKLCVAVVPKSRGFHPYIKAKSDKYNKDLVLMLSRHYQESERNAIEYLELLSREELVSIVSLYGYNKKQIENLLKKA
jgi:hypothetical protein